MWRWEGILVAGVEEELVHEDRWKEEEKAWMWLAGNLEKKKWSSENNGRHVHIHGVFNQLLLCFHFTPTFLIVSADI